MRRRLVFNMQDERPAWAPPPWVVPKLREAAGPHWDVAAVDAPASGRGDGGGASEEALRAVRGAEVLLTLGLPRPLLQAALEPPSQLRWIHSGAAGVASLLHPEIAAAGIVLTNSAGVHAEPIAETVMGMVLHYARGLDRAVHSQQLRAWSPAWFEQVGNVREVQGSTLGVVGYGGIGRAVAERARALGMNVLATRRSGGAPLDQVFGSSDFVVLCLPSTPATRGMVDAPRLACMQSHAVLINVGRGDVLDEIALADALRSGRLRGAALDVVADEPLPADSPLWSLPGVLLMPHVSATSPRFWERQMALILANLERYSSGGALLNVVDAGKGY